MGFFDFLKKIAGIADETSKPTNEKTSRAIESTEKDDTQFPTDFEHLTKDGELPFGWLYRNKEFTDKIESEYSYFLNAWLNNRRGTPKEHYQALKSFVLYLEDVERLCKSKGECFEWWFYEILASKDYITKRKKELEELTANFDDYQKKYENKLLKEEKIQTMKADVIILLKENDGILQSDFWKLFDDEICRAAATDIVYTLLKEGKIERTKSGKSYILHYKE